MISKKQIIKELAVKHKISYAQAEEVVQSQYKFVAHVFKRGQAESVRLPFFGQFHVNPKRLKVLKEINNGKGLRKIET